MSPSDKPLSRGQRAAVAAIAAVGYPLIAMLGRSCRWVVEGAEHLAGVTDSGRQPILALWHGRILPGTYFFRRRGIVVMTSEHRDGEWISRIITRFGFGTARGSSTRGGKRALLQMRREMAGGRGTAFTLDGPRGPALVAQPGALWLAKATGNPVVPFHAEASRAWVLPSWDRTLIPKPFSRVAMVIGAPIEVPSEADADRIELARRQVEEALASLADRARELARTRPGERSGSV